MNHWIEMGDRMMAIRAEMLSGDLVDPFDMQNRVAEVTAAVQDLCHAKGGLDPCELAAAVMAKTA